MATDIHEDRSLDELDTLDNWELEHKEQDIRGRPLVSATGERLGVIEDLLVDKGGERVAAVRLADGRSARVEFLEIHADRVVYRPQAAVAAGTTAGTHGDDRHDEQVIPVVEEELVVGKTVREGGTIRVSSRTVSETVGEDVTLRKERVDIDRVAVNEAIDPGKADALFQDKTIEVTERSEEAVVGKKAMVTGEVHVDKDVDVTTERVEGTVRRTEVDVDRTGVTGGRDGDPRTAR